MREGTRGEIAARRKEGERGGRRDGRECGRERQAKGEERSAGRERRREVGRGGEIGLQSCRGGAVAPPCVGG